MIESIYTRYNTYNFYNYYYYALEPGKPYSQSPRISNFYIVQNDLGDQFKHVDRFEGFLDDRDKGVSGIFDYILANFPNLNDLK